MAAKLDPLCRPDYCIALSLPTWMGYVIEQEAARLGISREDAVKIALDRTLLARLGELDPKALVRISHGAK